MLHINLIKKNNFFLVIIASFLLFSCSRENEKQSANDLLSQNINSVTATSTENVKLLRASAFTQERYGINYLRSFEIRVKNIAPTKKVFIHHKKKDGTWTNIEASYVKPLDSGYELWKGNYAQNEDSLSNQFVVGYTVNGTTYWDNNNGSNFTLNDNDGVLLNNHINIMSNSSYISSENFHVDIDIRNIAYNKKVQVIYSSDNWASTTTVNAKYVDHYLAGYALIYSPNPLGIERWESNASVGSKTSLQYYLKYEINGKVYYDNNFGLNYTVKVQ